MPIGGLTLLLSIDFVTHLFVLSRFTRTEVIKVKDPDRRMYNIPKEYFRTKVDIEIWKPLLDKHLCLQEVD